MNRWADSNLIAALYAPDTVIMKVIGVGLNKTGTKTLGYYLRQLGFRHRTYDYEAFQAYLKGDVAGLLQKMEEYDSFEDWPWPLFFREIDDHFPDARFVLTVRESPEVWYRSLCNMAVRMGPLKRYEKHIYGYAMPQGHREEHIQIYRAHNEAVLEHFGGRPDKLLEICWEEGDDAQKLARFLGVPAPEVPEMWVNRSSRRVYGGDSLLLAHINRVVFQTSRKARRRARRLARSVHRLLHADRIQER